MKAILTNANRSIVLVVASVGLGLLLLRPQPTWLPLVENYQTLINAENMGEAAPALLNDYARQPWNALRARNAGYAALELREYAGAQRYFTAAVELEGWTPALHRAMGDAYDGQGLSDQAVAEWEAAFAAGLTDEAILQRLAVAYEATGRYPEAVEVMRTLVTVRPDSAVVHYRLGVMLTVTAPQQAIVPLLTAAGLDQDGSVAPLTQRLIPIVETALTSDNQAASLAAIGYGLINVQEYSLASAALQQAIDHDPAMSAAYAYLGLAEEKQGRDGLATYQQALEINPDSPLTHNLLGIYWKTRGEFDRALAALERAYELDPLSPSLSIDIGSLHVASGDLVTAEIWYNNATRLDPDSAPLWVELAEFYLNNDFNANPFGYQAAERAAQIDPDYGAARDVFGFALWAQNQLDEAEAELLQAIELDPLRPSTYYHLGLVYQDLMRYNEAHNSYERAVALDPEGRIGNLALNALARIPAN